MIYLNGEILPLDQASISPADRGFLLGDGLFETLRAYRGRIAFAWPHLDRLEHGAAVLGLSLPQPVTALAESLYAILKANHLENGDAVLRLTLTRGPGPRGLLPPNAPQPTLLITAAPFGNAGGAPLRVGLASVRRNEHSPLAGVKSLNYLDSILARREAQARGLDDALLLNTAGRLACASAANLFVVSDGELLTPPQDDGALPGITRGVILREAERLGLPVSVRSLSPEDIFEAQEAFLTNSLVEIRPMAEFEGRLINAGTPGAVAARLLRAYQEAALAG